MRELARREPTFALHVHVAVPEPEAAIDALRGLRAHLPLLLALSANSPFWQGRDTGLASARTPVFSMFPRTGIPRAFADYAEYVEAIDVLVRCDAIPEPTYLWWDARLQPRSGRSRCGSWTPRRARGTPPRSPRSCSASCGWRRRRASPSRAQSHAWEAADENRFIASRDGMRAELIDVDAGPPPSVRRHPRRAAGRVRAARARARLRGGAGAACARSPELPGDERQRRQRGSTPGEQVGAELGPLVEALAAEFTAPRPEPAVGRRA